MVSIHSSEENSFTGCVPEPLALPTQIPSFLTKIWKLREAPPLPEVLVLIDCYYGLKDRIN
jgi:hypothetical protein